MFQIGRSTLDHSAMGTGHSTQENHLLTPGFWDSFHMFPLGNSTLDHSAMGAGHGTQEHHQLTPGFWQYFLYHTWFQLALFQ